MNPANYHIGKKSFIIRLRESFINDWQLYVLALPAIAYIFIFKYMPMYGLQMAFLDYTPSKGFDNSPFIGLGNFLKFFNNYKFIPVLKNTLYLSFYSLTAGFLPPIILALLLYKLRGHIFTSTVQTVSYAPHFISIVVMVGMMKLILSPSSGIINSIIVSLGGVKIDFMGNPKLFSHVYVWSGVWQNMGWSSIIYLSALTSINPEYYEAATIDGATQFQKIVNIDIPLLMPTAVTLLILACGHIMNMSVQKILLMQNPLNISSSEVISTYVYNTGILNRQYSYSAAVGLFQSVINVTMLLTANRIARSISETSLW